VASGPASDIAIPASVVGEGFHQTGLLELSNQADVLSVTIHTRRVARATHRGLFECGRSQLDASGYPVSATASVFVSRSSAAECHPSWVRSGVVGSGRCDAAELEAAGILTVTTEPDGTVTYALTREGKAIGRQLAMTQGEDARLAMLNELLDASPDT
jgi:hypothetical protein